MSKQYLTTHTVDNAHIADIFSLATTSKALLSASGASEIIVHRTNDPSYPISQSIKAHRLGCHHIATARGGTGKVAVSAGFGGELKIWSCNDGGDWSLHSEITRADCKKQGVGDIWAIALSADEQYVACTTHDGKIHVWDLVEKKKLQTYETGSATGGHFGMSVDLSRDGRLTASGHVSGAVYVFNNDTGRMAYSLSSLAKPVRAVAFSPGNSRLAAAGDAGIIALYDMTHGEHIGNLSSGSQSASWITSLDWSDTGEYLLSGSMDGKVKVWSIDRGVCVATHSETDKILWSARWLPKTNATKGELFCTAGENRSITFYREATGA